MLENVRAFKDINEQSDLSREIKVLAEVEKIWILYDLDKSETLDFEEVELYLCEMAYPDLTMDKD